MGLSVMNIITWIDRVLLSNGSVKNLSNRETVFLCSPRRAKARSLLLGNAAVNMHPQQWETVFTVGSVQRSYLKNKRRYSSEFSVEDSHRRFVEDLKCD
jgi:hypothetical protein